ncbi:MAG: V-type ATP synthase subunit K [Salinispira sp.]
MDIGMVGSIAAFTLAALGSALGIGAAAMAAVGAWKKCYIQNKPVPFLLMAFIGAPLTQTIYGLILMGNIRTAVEGGSTDPLFALFTGILSGIAIGASALYQGRAGANASDAFAETGKGFVNYILALGSVEVVALFVFIFASLQL